MLTFAFSSDIDTESQVPGTGKCATNSATSFLIAAKFSHSGDIGSTFTETISYAGGDIVMRWSDMGEPFMLAAAPEDDIVGDWGVYSCLTPARTAVLDVAGRRAAGKTYPKEMAGHPSGMPCLAWSETWLR